MKPPVNLNQTSRQTMRDVAEASGVSVMTVSRALRPNSAVSAATRQRVLAVVEAMNYVPDQMAGSLSSQKSGFIAALIPSLDNIHFAETIQSLSTCLDALDLQVLLGHTNYTAQQEEHILQVLLRRRPEYIVLTYDGHSQKTRQRLQMADVPIIEIWEQPEQPIQHTVGFSNFKAAYDMTLTLVARGYRKIGFLAEINDEGTRGAARRRGFEAAMSTSGLDAQRIVHHGAPPFNIQRGFAAAAVLLARYSDTECLFCVSDLAAFGALRYVQQQGRRVPDDIGIAGFGNFEVSRYASPRIATVAVDPSSVGRNTGDLIKRLQRAPRAAAVAAEHIHLPVTLELRESI